MRRRSVHNWSSGDLRYPVCQGIRVSAPMPLPAKAVHPLLLARTGTERLLHVHSTEHAMANATQAILGSLQTRAWLERSVCASHIFPLDV